MSHKYIRIIVGIFAILIPILVSLSIPYVLYGKAFFDIMPLWNDEVIAWHEILTFSKVGFNGGYYTVEEVPAFLSFTHFYSHGPVFPMFFGMFGRVFGWHPWSGAVFNTIFFFIASAVFVFLVKPDFKQSVALGLLLLTFWPSILYLPTAAMQQILHQVFAVLLSVLSWNAIVKGKEAHLAIKLTSILFIFFISFIRPTWGFLYFPFLLFYFLPSSKLRLALALLIASVTNILIMFMFGHLRSPYPDGFVAHLHSAIINSSFDNAIKLFSWHMQRSITLFFSLNNGHLMEILLRLNLMVIIVTFAIIGIGILLFRQRKGKIDAFHFIVRGREALFHLLNLGLPLVFNILFYDIFDWRDFRLLAPHVLLSMLVLIVSKKRLWLIGFIVGINLVGVTSFIPLYKAFHTQRFIHDEQTNISFDNSIKIVLKYDHDKAESPWCNTLLSTAIAPPSFIYVPAGIGFSLILNPMRLQLPLKSKYLLLDATNYQKWGGRSLLSRTPFGDLHLNKDSMCD